MRQVSLRRLVLVPALLGVLSIAGDGSAYCVSTVCEGVDACDGEEIPGCPTLRWPNACVGYDVHELGGSGLSADTVELVTDLAFDQWREVMCGEQRAGVVMQNLGQVACGAVEYNKDAGNANIVLFNEEWPHSEASHTYALTTTTFDPETGDLLNADIELNSRDHAFTVNDEAVQADLLSVLTHEIGHFMGIAHSNDPDATMFAFYEQGSTELRTLHPDDAAALCALYPPRNDLDGSCNPLPKHGFSPECRANQGEGSCAAAPGAPSSNEGASGLLVAGALALTARSARRRRSSAR